MCTSSIQKANRNSIEFSLSTQTRRVVKSSRTKSLQSSLVNSLGYFVLGFQSHISRVSNRHGHYLVLDSSLQFSPKFDNQGMEVYIAGVGDQGLKEVQIVFHCLIVLIVGGPLQDISGICLCIDQKELSLELLFKG